MIDSIKDGILDSLKIFPFLLITFLILEFIEHKINHKNEKLLTKNKKYGPFIGSLIGAFPQCGFSVVASNLFSSRVITMGTLISVYLSTSDEMLPMLISEHANIILILEIVLSKIVIGMIIGFIVDFIYRKKIKEPNGVIHDMCEKDHCSCEKDGIIMSSLKHTFKIFIFILIANLLINLIIFYIGEDKLSNLLLNKNIVTYFIASLLGLIPNCAVSVIITKLYLSGIITIGILFSGLLTGSGLGILLLFKTNKNIKENILILSIIYITGVVIGILIDFII